MTLPPMIATVRVRPTHWRRGFRLRLPLFLVWLLLLPLLILLLPLLLLFCLIVGINLLRSLGAIFAVLASLKDTQVEIERPDKQLFIDLN